MLKKIQNALIWIYSIPINYKVFPKDIAKKLPLRVSYWTKCIGLSKGCIEIQADNIYKGMIQIGMKQGSHEMDQKEKSAIVMENGSKIIFYGPADFSHTINIRVFENALLEIKKGFFCNANASINVSKHVSIGENALWGWNVEIIDTDGHDILDMDGNVTNFDRDIVIGDDVWLGANVGVLKGTKIPKGCIVGYRSVVSGKFEEENSIIAGFPAKIIRSGVCWSRDKTNFCCGKNE